MAVADLCRSRVLPECGVAMLKALALWAEWADAPGPPAG